ncbi:hypothetical protein LshimejAT787_0904770 [Lyophyllum shimeji]|uniref:Uncharacterized protein n=1 Tax=Lyophyllum shimeji TaxID=47721 RepID=A0A9P3UQH0_LYOSH|nr:hypothetical protein LshimejAT787_0904770 [Lyophyllum shimeji]
MRISSLILIASSVFTLACATPANHPGVMARHAEEARELAAARGGNPSWKREPEAAREAPGWKRAAEAEAGAPGWKREGESSPPGWKRAAATPPGWRRAEQAAPEW